MNIFTKNAMKSELMHQTNSVGACFGYGNRYFVISKKVGGFGLKLSTGKVQDLLDKYTRRKIFNSLIAERDRRREERRIAAGEFTIDEMDEFEEDDDMPGLYEFDRGSEGMITTESGINICTLFEGPCDYEGKCDTCPVLGGYSDYCASEQEVM